MELPHFSLIMLLSSSLPVAFDSPAADSQVPSVSFGIEQPAYPVAAAPYVPARIPGFVTKRRGRADNMSVRIHGATSGWQGDYEKAATPNSSYGYYDLEVDVYVYSSGQKARAFYESEPAKVSERTWRASIDGRDGVVAFLRSAHNTSFDYFQLRGDTLVRILVSVGASVDHRPLQVDVEKVFAAYRAERGTSEQASIRNPQSAVSTSVWRRTVVEGKPAAYTVSEPSGSELWIVCTGPFADLYVSPELGWAGVYDEQGELFSSLEIDSVLLVPRRLRSYTRTHIRAEELLDEILKGQVLTVKFEEPRVLRRTVTLSFSLRGSAVAVGSLPCT